MWKKAISLGLLGLGLQLSLWASLGNAYEYADTPTAAADGIHIPQKLTLLEDIPYYVIPNALLNKAEGSFSPQTVDVIEAEVNWATSPNWWKIHTAIGDRWIKTAPWQIEAPPPPTISLMAETPIYAKPSEKIEPSAALSPQNVTVVDAEKGWFKQESNDYNPKKWIKIHTTWLGDQWVHLHLDQIGSYQPIDQMAFYSNIYYNLKPHIDNQTYQYDGILSNQFLHQIGQFHSILGSYYEVGTDGGTKWALADGLHVIPETKTLTRTHPSPLYTYPSPYEVPMLVLAGDLQVFEKINKEASNDSVGEWYHVRTDQGEGWFNPTFAEPEDATIETATIQLYSAVTRLYRYPNTDISLENGQLGPQSIHPLAAWTAPNGIRWFQINSFVGQAWIQLEPREDRLVLKDRASDMQMKGDSSYQGAFYKKDGNYTYGTETIGYDMQGQPYFNSAFLASLYPFNLTGPDVEGWWTLTNATGYSFRIKAGELKARTLWKGNIAKIVTLAAPPASSDNDGSPLLSLADIRTLFGITSMVSRDNAEVLLSARQYDVAPFQLPTIANGTHAHLSGLLYETTYSYSNNSSNAISQTLQITVADRDTGEPLNTTNVAAMKLLYNLNMYTGLYDISLDQPLKPGINHLSVVFKVGERIILQRDWDVTGPAQ